MRIKVIEQALLLDESSPEGFKIFASDTDLGKETALDKLIEYVIERNNKYSEMYYFGIDKDHDYYIKQNGPDGRIIFLADCPRAFLSRIKNL